MANFLCEDSQQETVCFQQATGRRSNTKERQAKRNNKNVCYVSSVDMMWCL
jgi:hypothetical protein